MGREGERKLVFVMSWMNGTVKLLHHCRGNNREYYVHELCFCSLSNSNYFLLCIFMKSVI